MAVNEVGCNKARRTGVASNPDVVTVISNYSAYFLEVVLRVVVTDVSRSGKTTIRVYFGQKAVFICTAVSLVVCAGGGREVW